MRRIHRAVLQRVQTRFEVPPDVMLVRARRPGGEQNEAGDEVRPCQGELLPDRRTQAESDHRGLGDSDGVEPGCDIMGEVGHGEGRVRT